MKEGTNKRLHSEWLLLSGIFKVGKSTETNGRLKVPREFSGGGEIARFEYEVFPPKHSC